MDTLALAAFLRGTRERLRPEDLGLPAGARRRTPGLRREEVAGLAHVSVDHYARLEQARGRHPSPQVLGGIARALRLTDQEQQHLFRLAGTTPDAPADGCGGIDGGGGIGGGMDGARPAGPAVVPSPSP